MTDYQKSSEPELGICYFDNNVLWIGASGVLAFSEGETMAQGIILEYDREGPPSGVVLTKSALNRLKDFFYPGRTETAAEAL